MSVAIITLHKSTHFDESNLILLSAKNNNHCVLPVAPVASVKLLHKYVQELKSFFSTNKYSEFSLVEDDTNFYK